MLAVAMKMAPDLTFCAVQDGTIIQMRTEADGISVEVWPNAMKCRYTSFEKLITSICSTEPLHGHIEAPIHNLQETIAWFLPEKTDNVEVETVDNPTIEDLDIFAANFTPLPLVPEQLHRPMANA